MVAAAVLAAPSAAWGAPSNNELVVEPGAGDVAAPKTLEGEPVEPPPEEPPPEEPPPEEPPRPATPR